MTGAPHIAGPRGDWWPPLLHYWFETLNRQAWFAKNDAVDAHLRETFGPLPEFVAGLDLAPAAMQPLEVLAAILALDQLPRNLFRGTQRSFAYDAKALRLASQAVALGKEAGLSTDQRAFFYLPFEHSEDIADQERSVDLISGLGDAEYTRFAIAHRNIIARFGRFPHRNAVLGRASTREELGFLQEPGSAF